MHRFVDILSKALIMFLKYPVIKFYGDKKIR